MMISVFPFVRQTFVHSTPYWKYLSKQPRNYKNVLQLYSYYFNFWPIESRVLIIVTRNFLSNRRKRITWNALSISYQKVMLPCTYFIISPLCGKRIDIRRHIFIKAIKNCGRFFLYKAIIPSYRWISISYSSNIDLLFFGFVFGGCF